jgi:hypothetical protein
VSASLIAGSERIDSGVRSRPNDDRQPQGVAPSAESVARSVCGLVGTTTVLSRCDRGADEKWRRQVV